MRGTKEIFNSMRTQKTNAAGLPANGSTHKVFFFLSLPVYSMPVRVPDLVTHSCFTT
jgi:hypothetical protein